MRSRQLPGFCAFPASCKASANGQSSAIRAVKICGVTSVADANLVAKLVRRELPSSIEPFLGMILWPGAKRSVSFNIAAEIAHVATRHGMTPVGVFVDETREVIVKACSECGIVVAQTHGQVSRNAV
eukprot:IDg14749t1